MQEQIAMYGAVIHNGAILKQLRLSGLWCLHINRQKLPPADLLSVNTARFVLTCLHIQQNCHAC